MRHPRPTSLSGRTWTALVREAAGHGLYVALVPLWGNDYRLRELVQSTGSIQHAIRRGVPRSTAHEWLKSPRAEVVTVDATDMDVLRLQEELLTLADVSPGSLRCFVFWSFC